MKSPRALLLAAALLIAAPALADDQTLAITSDANDGCESGLGWVDGADGYLEVGGGGGRCAYSFTLTATIPDDATIDFAFLSAVNAGDNNSSHTVGIFVEDVDPASAAPFDNSSEKPSDKTWLPEVSTGAREYMAGDYFGDGETGETDIAALIQDLVDDYGELATGQRINLKIDGATGSANGYSLWDVTTSAATLYIEWTAAGGGGSVVPIILQQMSDAANDGEYDQRLVANAR